MSGNTWLDSTLLAISLFDVVVMLWLGLMILLSAEKRTQGVTLAASGLLAGAAFFILHAWLVGQTSNPFFSAGGWWWSLIWGPVILVPFIWYVVMLWFSGFWDDPNTPLYARHLPWLRWTGAYGLLVVILFLSFHPFDAYTASTGSIPAFYIAYPIYILLCIALSMAALTQPGPSQRLMGKKAREKARPWLIAASFVLLVVSGIVGFAIAWVAEHATLNQTLPEVYGNLSPSLAWFDLVLSALITIAVLLIGQAVVSYEIFTGKSLPRRGFHTQWVSTLLMAILFSVTMAVLVALKVQSIFLVIFSVVMLAIFFVFLSWNYSRERERYMQQMRLFVQHPNAAVSVVADVSNADIQVQFGEICREVLHLRSAAIIPRGSLAQLHVAILAFPDCRQPILEDWQRWIVAENPLPEQPVGMETELGETWVIPLWSSRGLDALFFLDEKEDGSFLASEEIEIARAAGEHLVELLLTTELTQRLLAVQQDRMDHQWILDQTPRRVIHDEVLPQIHTAILELSSVEQQTAPGTMERLSRVHGQLSALLSGFPSTAVNARREKGFLPALHEFVDREFSRAFGVVKWDEELNFGEQLAACSDTVQEVVYNAAREIIRNAARYARTASGAPADLTIRCYWQEHLILEIEDAGQWNTSRPTLKPGHGLELHSLLMAVIGGTLQIQHPEGKGTLVRLIV